MGPCWLWHADKSSAVMTWSMLDGLSGRVSLSLSVPAGSSGAIASSYEAQANRVLAASSDESDRLAELSLTLSRMCCGAHLMLR